MPLQNIFSVDNKSSIMNKSNLLLIIITILYLFGCTSSIRSYNNRTLVNEKLLETSGEKNEWVDNNPGRNHSKCSSSGNSRMEAREQAINKIYNEINMRIGYVAKSENKYISIIEEIRNSYGDHAVNERHKIVSNFDKLANNIIEDVNSNIIDTYWESYKRVYLIDYKKKIKCKEYDYWILWNYPDSKIRQLRQKTKNENDIRINLIKNKLQEANADISGGDLINALLNCINAYWISDTLFSDSDIYRNNVLLIIKRYVNDLRIINESNYSEINPRKHYIKAKIYMDDMLVKNIPIKFKLLKGTGSIDENVYTDIHGIAQSDVRMSQRKHDTISDNKIRAYLNISEYLKLISDLKNYKYEKTVDFMFSTKSKYADVEASPLSIYSKGFALFKSWYLSFVLNEVNGMGMVINRRRVCIKQRFREKKIFREERFYWKSDIIYESVLENNIRLEGYESQNIEIEMSREEVDRIKKVQREREFYKMNIYIVLFGQDLNGREYEINIPPFEITKERKL